MSISQNQSGQVKSEVTLQPQRNRRIRKEILSLFTEPRLKGKISIPVFDLNEIKVYLLLQNVNVDLAQQALLIYFPQDFPITTPILKLDNNDLPSQLLTQGDSLESWTSASKLADIISEVYENLNNYIESQKMYLKSSQSIMEKPQQKIKSEQQGSKKKLMMNGCGDTQLTETKNLNRHFRSKLRQVYLDLMKLTPTADIPEDAKLIDQCFGLSRVGFEDISRILRNQWFSQQVHKQMMNGKFMHKIMKGMMSIKSKKLMVKYYHVMIAAAQDPDNFVKWKYQ